jgi:hypothetical protein
MAQIVEEVIQRTEESQVDEQASQLPPNDKSPVLDFYVLDTFQHCITKICNLDGLQ